jgi:hypothetical protein
VASLNAAEGPAGETGLAGLMEADGALAGKIGGLELCSGLEIVVGKRPAGHGVKPGKMEAMRGCICWVLAETDGLSRILY